MYETERRFDGTFVPPDDLDFHLLMLPYTRNAGAPPTTDRLKPTFDQHDDY